MVIFYNWFAVDDDRGVCPEGWHVPSDTEYAELEIELGMSPDEVYDFLWRGTDEGGKLKEVGTANWYSPNYATNETGFTALPGGYRNPVNGFSYDAGSAGYFWTSSIATYGAYQRGLWHGHADIHRAQGEYQTGYSVRCIEN